MNAMARDLSQLGGPSGSGHQPAGEIQVMHTSGGVQRVANWHPRNRRPSCVARGQLVRTPSPDVLWPHSRTQTVGDLALADLARESMCSSTS